MGCSLKSVSFVLQQPENNSVCICVLDVYLHGPKGVLQILRICLYLAAPCFLPCAAQCKRGSCGTFRFLDFAMRTCTLDF